jgi:hypothetical protein
MATRHIISFGLVGGAALAACFGGGPEPTAPTEAKVVFAVPPADGAIRCNGSATYISDVALDTDTGYAALVPYIAGDCPGTQQVDGPESIESFALAGGSQAMVADLGRVQTNGNAIWPKLAITPSGPLWLYGNDAGNSLIGSAQGSSSLGLTGQMSLAFAYNLNTWVAVGSTMGMGAQPADPGDPRYPCCGGNDVQALSVTAGLLDVSGSTASVSATHGFSVQSYPLQNTLAVDGTGDAYAFADNAGGVTLARVDGNGTPVAIDTSSSQPVGLAFDSATNALVWSMSPPVFDSASSNTPGCSIWRYDLASGGAASILSTTRFSCMDAVAGEDGAIYFAIIDADGTDSDHAIVHGDGIGRVSYDGATFESIALRVSGVAAGPRRIHVQAGTLYVVDPAAVATIDEHALDGAHDYAP